MNCDKPNSALFYLLGLLIVGAAVAFVCAMWMLYLRPVPAGYFRQVDSIGVALPITFTLAAITVAAAICGKIWRETRS